MDEVSGYYDEFAERQERVGVNLRHLRILEHLRRFGLKRGSRVLEIGCGIGTVTELIAGWAKYGSITAVDISPKSIDLARTRLGSRKSVTFVVSDMSDFPRDETFDVIVLPDVLEHIPPEQHVSLWQTISELLEPNGFVFVHIPNPAYLKWLIKNRPEQLQIIDLPVKTHEQAAHAAQAGLTIVHLETYSIFNREPDYRLFVLRHDGDAETETARSPKVLGIQTILAKIRRII